MDSLEIVPPPRPTTEMMQQVGSQSPAISNKKKKKVIPKDPEEVQLLPVTELPVPLVAPWAISNVFVEGSQMVEPVSPGISGGNKPHSPQDMTPDGRPTWPLPVSDTLLKGAKMPKVDKAVVKEKKLNKKRQRLFKVAVFASGALVGYVLVNMLDNQKQLIKAVNELTNQTATLENVVAAYVVK